MSCLENDRIWDKVNDAYANGELTFEEIMAMDLDDAFDYLMYGIETTPSAN